MGRDKEGNLVLSEQYGKSSYVYVVGGMEPKVQKGVS